MPELVWDPVTYLGHADHRTRPGAELLARIHHEAPRHIVDLGCGTGHLTAAIAERWPEAQVIGIDLSADMLERARADQPHIRFEQDDIASWAPRQPVDVLYSNAALHWVDDHRTLFRRLLSHLSPGGVLAVQMPNNFGAPSHTSLHAAVEASPDAESLRRHLRTWPLLSVEGYYDALSSHADHVDIWETEYVQVMHGEEPIFDWTSGALLRPLLTALDGQPGVRDAVLADYRARVRDAYPRRPDGTTLFPYRRIFMVARMAP